MNEAIETAMKELDIKFKHQLGEIFEVKNGRFLLNVEITKRNANIIVDPDTGLISHKVLYSLETVPRSSWNWDNWTDQHIHEVRYEAKFARIDKKL
jgi:hypothetical protein